MCNPSRDEGEEEAPEAMQDDSAKCCRDEIGRVSSRSGEHSSRVQGGNHSASWDTSRLERRNGRGAHWKGLELTGSQWLQQGLSSQRLGMWLGSRVHTQGVNMTGRHPTERMLGDLSCCPTPPELPLLPTSDHRHSALEAAP